MARRGGTSRIGDVVASLLQKRHYGRTLALEEASEAWCRAAGPAGRVIGLRDGILVVEVGSASERYELEAFRGPEILAALQADVDGPPVRKLQFRVGTRQT